MAKRLSLPTVLGGVILGFVTGVSVTFGAIMVTGVSAADEPGTPLDFGDVTVSTAADTAKATPAPDAATQPEAGAGANADASDSSHVVPALPPVEVTLDDHGGDSHGDDDSGSNSGSSGSGGSGSSGSSGSNSGSGSSGSGSSGSNSSGSNSSGDSTP